MGNIDQIEFEQVKQKIMRLSPKQKKELGILLNYTHQGPLKSAPQEHAEGFYRQLQFVLHQHQQSNPPMLPSLKRTSPSLYHRILAIDKELTATLDRLFPKVTKIQFEGLRMFFIQMAAHRIEDMERTVTLQMLLDCLIPLEELIDDQLPGYRASGILQQVILNKISGREQCLDKTL